MPSNETPKHMGMTATAKDKFGDGMTLHKTRHGWRKKLPRVTPLLAFNRVLAVVVGSKIAEMRKAKGLTLEELAILTGAKGGCPKTRQWRMENPFRGYGIHIGTLFVMADALGCKPDDLLPSLEDVREVAAMIEGLPDADMHDIRAMLSSAADLRAGRVHNHEDVKTDIAIAEADENKAAQP